MQEEHLLTGLLEHTNEPYAIAKIAGLKLCEAYKDQYGCNFIACMPTNLYGRNDNYDLQNSHVLPALVRKFHEAKTKGEPSVMLWGDGSPMREFLYVDDLAEACLFLMLNYNENSLINIGSGTEVSIKDLAQTVQSVVGFEGQIVWDTSKPNGTPRKLMDSSKLKRAGFEPQIPLNEGIRLVYADFESHYQRYTSSK